MPIGIPSNNEAIKNDLKDVGIFIFPQVPLKLFNPCVDMVHDFKESILSEDVPDMESFPQIRIKLWRPCFMTTTYNEAKKDDNVDFVVSNKMSINLPFKSFVAKPAYRQVCVQFDGGGTDGCSEDS